MNVEVSWAGILLATLASMAVGGIWYAKPVFGKVWMKLVGLKEEDTKKGQAQALLIGLVCAFLTAYVLAHVAYLSNQYFRNSFMQDSMTTAFWLSVGISATTVITHNTFEKRKPNLTWLTVLHQIVGFLIMGAIIGAFKPFGAY